MPVLMTGSIPVATTRRTSIAAGTPMKSRAGIGHSALRAAAISAIWRVQSSASAAEPAPTKPATAGAAAIAKPPRPIVSTIALSPMSGLASASENPGK
jgi:hypothetical protein